MFGRGDHDQRIGRERLRARVELARRATHDGEVDLLALQLIDQRLAITDLQAELDAGMLAPELGQKPRHEILGRTHQPERQPAAAHALEARDGVLGIFERAEHPPRVQ